jgi:hypothetical protein
MTQFSKKKIISQKGATDLTSTNARITNLENNEYKVTYYEIISGASGSITIPTGATINAGEFGLSGNCILSKIDGSNKPTFESPKTSGGTIVTASLNETTGAWVASGTYTDADVALIYSIKIKAVYYSNLDYDFIIETAEIDAVNTKGSIQNYYSGKRVTIPFAGTSTAINGWNGAIIYIPIPITSSVAFTDISQEVTALAVGSNIRLALYTSVNGLPSALLEDSGNLSSATIGIKNYVLSAPHSFTAVDKQVFVAIQSSSAAVGLRYALNSVCFNYFNGSGQSGGLFNQVQVFGAFPATATPSVYANANSPLVSLLVQ